MVGMLAARHEDILLLTHLDYLGNLYIDNQGIFYMEVKT
jgi:hypothetical protein